MGPFDANDAASHLSHIPLTRRKNMSNPLLLPDDHEPMKLLSMLKDKPSDEWVDSIDLVGPEGICDELGVQELATELLKTGEPIGLTSGLAGGWDGFATQGFVIKLATNAEEIAETQQVVDEHIAHMVAVKTGLERAQKKVAH